MGNNKKIKLALLLGTRPEIIKMSPIIRELIKRKINFFVLHTNQHYSENLEKVFFRDLNLPRPKYNLGVGSGTHANQTAKMLVGMEGILIKEKPDMVLIYGDPNTALAGALVASKLKIKLAHIEAGLRSYFREMPEEINRILADHCSDILFTPTKKAKEILIGEGVHKDKIFVVGDTSVDAIGQNLELAQKKSKIFEKLDISKNKYFLVTAHRVENVDKKQRLKGILGGLKLVYNKFQLPIIFSIHPRTKKMMDSFKLKMPEGIKAIEPVGYLNFLKLEANARLVLTDSGGMQDETCILKVPCVTLRDNTERPETVKVKSNVLAGVNPYMILEGAEKMLNKKRNWKNPLGKRGVAKRIINIICAS